MKKTSVLFAILMIAMVSLFAQAPQKFSYQAVLRDAGNNLVTSQAVGIRISILQGSVNGSVAYMETQTAVTNANGLVTLQIGGGNVLSGDMSAIDWANGPFFLKTEADPTGGANYTIEGTQQLLSVPYALYAGNSISGFSGDYNDLINTPDIPTVPTNVSAFNNDAQYITQAALGSTLQGYATVGSIPTVPTDVSAFNNDAGYITAADVQQAAEVPTNVSAFVNDAGYITMDSVPSIPTDVSAFSNDASYVTQSVLNVTLSNYATLNTLPTVPVNVSSFYNDAGYITAADVQQAANIPTNVSAFNNDAGYVTMASVPAIPTNVSTFTNDAGYITAAQVPAQVPADWNATTGPSRILNKPTIPTVPANVSAFYNDRGYITAANIPSNVSAFTNDAGYITSADVQQAANIPTNVSAFTNDAGYVTQPVLNVTLSNYATLNSLPTIPVNVSSFYNDAGYITSADVQQAANIPTNVSAFTNDAGYITMASVPTVPTAVSSLTNDIGYITAAQVPAQVPADWNATTGPSRILNKPVIPTVPANVSSFNNDAGYITASNIPSNISAFNNDRGYITAANVPTNVSAFVNDRGYVTAAEIPAQVNADWNATTGAARILNKPTIPTVPTNLSAFTNDQGFITIASVPTNISAFVNDRGYITSSGVPTNVAAFENDAHYITEAQFTTILTALNSTLDSLRNRIAELEAAPPTSGSVTISPVTNITEHTAMCGGEVLTDGGMPIIERGLCWSTSHNPTTNDSHTMDGAGTGSFTSTLTGLAAGTTYYVRAYAVNSVGTAYSGELSFTTMTDACQGVATITDIDGNVYNTVSIGNQCWMKENLRTTKYTNGTTITNGSSASTSTSTRYYYNSGNSPSYGYLYNWSAVKGPAAVSANNQGVCPNGWHVPSSAEWTLLKEYVSSQSQYCCSNNTANIAKAIASTTGWTGSSNACAVGNTQSNNNATGFSALPAGNFGYAHTHGNGSYNDIGECAYFWSATVESSNLAYVWNISYGNANMWYHTVDKGYGFSVRCVRD